MSVHINAAHRNFMQCSSGLSQCLLLKEKHLSIMSFQITLFTTQCLRDLQCKQDKNDYVPAECLQIGRP